MRVALKKRAPKMIYLRTAGTDQRLFPKLANASVVVEEKVLQKMI
jgi:hypothetical protein